MLSHVSIEQRIQAGEIRIIYYFLPDTTGAVNYFPDGRGVDWAKQNAPETRFFKDRLFSDRLNLTLGPIVKSHDKRFYSSRQCFRSRTGYTDIRANNGILYLAPHETVSIATNERIILGASTFALILPRITLGDAGILLNVAYIDAFWDGTLQLVLSNSTTSTQQLSLLEPIAQCLFFNLLEPADNRFRQSFPAKSHHYGQTWHKILDEDAEPFPLRKRPVARLSGLNHAREVLSNFLYDHGTKIKALGALLLVVAGIGGWYQVTDAIRDIPEMKQSLAKISPYFENQTDFNIPALRQSITELVAKSPVTGLVSIPVAAGATHAETLVTVEKNISPSSAVWVETVSRDDSVHVSANLNSMNGSQVTIRIAAKYANPSAEPRSISVKWLLVP